MFYDSIFTEQATTRLEIESEIRHAVEHDAFTLRYQPKVDLNSGKIIGAEALVRMQHNNGSLIQPDNFIPVAEETG
ncbi:EAL domain-containing protein [Candidatus Reidiella endopervernicosa]|uniref:EAL domain-containing protein n=1 Tax=Candidatus Reidiella endopervernicosa TaxID=2738883 RepID=A0A6N0I1J7_9GAMM|nr:EAL domain-containing protein [Candidatus Reidiella endopervernicosa]